MLPVEQPFKTYTGLDGKPLDNGSVYFGQPGQDPIAHPATVYWDAAGTIPAAQPLRTVSGYILNSSGAVANVFFDGPYSELVQDSKGRQVFYAQTSGDFSVATFVSQEIEGLSDALQLADYAALRAYAGTREGVYVVAIGLAGMFVRDDLDTASADNGGTVIVAANGKRWKRVYSGPASIKWFGAVGDGVTDNTAVFAAAFAACKSILIPGNAGEVYKTSKYPRANDIEVTGVGYPTINLFYNDTPVMVQFGDRAIHTGIKFNSTEANLEFQRAGLEQATGAKIVRCGFYGFRHVSSAPNAWGLHIVNSTDCIIDRCDFGNNSQSDIALTDNNKNITIFHPTNATDSGVYLDVEPNGDNGTNGLLVIGGAYRMVSLLENSYTAYASRNIHFSGATVTKLMYDGSEATFDDACSIGTITNETNQYVYGGNLDMSLGLSGNLIDDPYLVDLALINASGEWMGDYVSSTWSVDRVRDAAGTYVRSNKANIDQAHWLKSKKIPVLTGTNPLLVLHIGRSQIPAGAGWVGKRDYIEYFNAANVSIGSSYIAVTRGLAGTTTPMIPHWAVALPPAGTSYVVLHMSYDGFITDGGTHSPICDHILAMGVYEISSMEKASNTREIASRLIQGSNNIVTKASHVPNTAQHVGAFAGTRVINSAAAAGSTPAWDCVVTGAPGTWAAEAVLTAA